MPNHVSCNNGILDIDTLLKSVFTEITATNKVALRVTSVSYGDALTEQCMRDDINTLFRRAICIAEDGLPSIRLVQQTHAQGAGLQPVTCANNLTLDELKRQVFCRDTDGNIAIQTVQIPEL